MMANWYPGTRGVFRWCSEELNNCRVHRRGAPDVPGSSDSRPQIFEHALLARTDVWLVEQVAWPYRLHLEERDPIWGSCQLRPREHDHENSIRQLRLGFLKYRPQLRPLNYWSPLYRTSSVTSYASKIYIGLRVMSCVWAMEFIAIERVLWRSME